MADRAALHDALAASQRLGMLGGRPVDDVIEHATAFVSALADVTGTVVDLGSGGGVPGLVIAVARPDLALHLVERRASRADHLARLVRRLGVDARVHVHPVDASTLVGRLVGDAVVARSFGSPAVTLAAAAGLIRAGGVLVVSEPPADASTERWPPTLLGPAGFVLGETVDARVVRLVKHRVPRET